MKSSWIAGVFMFYLLIFGVELIVTEGNVFSNVITSGAGTLSQPSFAVSSNIFSQVWAVLSIIGDYISMFIQAVFLYNASVFSGYMVWFYWFICFPVACATIYGVVQLIRGTG